MRNCAQQLWNDEGGFVVSVELIMVATVAVFGLLAGMTAMRDAVVSEMSDVAGAVQEVNQSFRYFGVLGHSASTAGADYTDLTDYCDDSEHSATAPIDNCITIEGVNEIEEGGAVAAPAP